MNRHSTTLRTVDPFEDGPLASTEAVHRTAQGFTILELMIALSVLATLLLIATVVLINLGGLFSKGTNEANVQNATRNVMNEVVGQIKLGANTPVNSLASAPASSGAPDGYSTSGLGAFCIGNLRYTYLLNAELGVDSQHVLWRDITSGAGSCTPITSLASFESSTPPASGSELMPARSRLISFSIDSGVVAGTYTVKITVAYGDGDLITYTPNVPAAPAPYDSKNATAVCKGGAGDQYCAVASLIGTATQRIQ